jgi:hypothetical protein
VVTGHSDDTRATAILLRPDCYIAWESEAPGPDAAALSTALTRWFGETVSQSQPGPRTVRV